MKTAPSKGGVGGRASKSRNQVQAKIINSKRIEKQERDEKKETEKAKVAQEKAEDLKWKPVDKVDLKQQKRKTAALDK